MAVELFISYHEADHEHLQALEKALKRNPAKPTVWHRGLVAPGEEVEALAARRFERARVIALLLSHDYLDRDSLYDEATLARQRQTEGTARVVPIMVRPCNIEGTSLEGLATLPRGAAAITRTPDRDEAWSTVASEMGAVIREVASRSPAPAPAASEPYYRDDATRELGRRLQETLRRRDEFLDQGKDDVDLIQEILNLKRKLREDGQLKAGDVLGERRYKLIERIGEGGFADVWRAEMGAERLEVAVKVLHANLASDSVRVERFFRGARAMARLQHPAVVRILEQHGEDRGWHYFVMELVQGKNLHDAVLAGEVPKDRMPSILLAVGEALTEAHRRGMTHRDVKPSNILLDDEGTPKLTDFDLVAVDNSIIGTRTSLVGSYLYAAPELRHRAREADKRADIYGLGMTALFCWHGQDVPPEVDWEPDEVLDALACGAPVREVLRKAIAKKVAARHESMTTFCDALREATSNAKRFNDMVPLTNITNGSFAIISTINKEGGEGNGPLHRIVVDAFSLSKLPVSVAQYAAVMGERFSNVAPDLPAIRVSWVDAVDFCNKLSHLAGLEPCYTRDMFSVTWNREANGFRLPTETEWIYAWCRWAGSTDLLKVKDEQRHLRGYARSEGDVECTAAPSSVWEWVWDTYQDQEPQDGNGALTCLKTPIFDQRVAIGGEYRKKDLGRCYKFRKALEPETRSRILGFRCAAPPHY